MKIRTFLGTLSAIGSSIASAQSDVSFDVAVLHQYDGSAFFGDSVVTGDANGDGYLDVAFTDATPSYIGQAWVRYGPSFEELAVVALPNAAVGDELGGNLSSLLFEDLNGDGLDDLVVTGSRSNLGTTTPNIGRAYVSFGPSFSSTVELVNPIADEEAYFGRAAAVYDMTGDGHLDVVVGALKADGPGGAYAVGKVFIYAGPTFDMAPVKTLLPQPPDASSFFGRILHFADVDNDGDDDVLTSNVDPQYNQFVWLLDLNQDTPLSFDSPLWALPTLNSLVIDLDNDGFLDLVGADGSTSISESVGVVWGPMFDASSVIADEHLSSSGFGDGLDVADVDRDGWPDLVIGAPFADFEGEIPSEDMQQPGRISIYFGPDLDPAQRQDIWGPHAYARLGMGLDLVDFDGDGFAEMFVGAANEYGGRIKLYDHQPLRAVGTTQVSLSTGGAVDLSLEAGPLSGGQLYLILVGASGSVPGIELPGPAGALHLPLVPDLVTTAALDLIGTPTFQGFLGVTDPNGTAAAKLTLPPGLESTSLAGATLTLAAVVGPPTGFDYAAGPVAIELVP
ncbi:FG-GAP repeat domain-containing protein [Engelhardtia mirabilis]|uniref:FG-GAP repeat protein n=1 Tax=Engelhardtia mirabilis TaxID=2528011 RepID=A0A518BRF8_9BACT|nr:FG-GAP repeat protein [Planctomycetes bacterium Pla133]QDV03883.1 FG-GAP repeat protein [Planctomycetes bacterium Pla86]